MAKLAGQKLRASYLAGTTAGYYLLASTVGLPAGSTVKASQIP
jgi:hypothetical protein